MLSINYYLIPKPNAIQAEKVNNKFIYQKPFKIV